MKFSKINLQFNTFEEIIINKFSSNHVHVYEYIIDEIIKLDYKVVGIGAYINIANQN